MNSPTDNTNNQAHATAQTHAAGFEMAADDPRRTDNRGGLEAIVDAGETASEENAHEQGRDVSGAGNIATPPDGAGLGAAETGQSAVWGRVDAAGTGLHAPKTGVPGAGEIDSYASGAQDVQVEVSDVGLIDVHSAGTGAPDEDEQQSDGAARVEGSDGQPL